jgi:hypothetical protein
MTRGDREPSTEPGADPAVSYGSPVPRRPSRKVLLWSAGGVVALVLVLAGVSVLYSAGNRRDIEAVAERHRARLAIEREQIAKDVRSRPALALPAQEGDAHRIVLAYLRALDRVPDADHEAIKQWSNHEEDSPSEEAVDAIFAAHPAPVEALEPFLHVAASGAPSPPKRGGYVDKIAPYSRASVWLECVSERAFSRGRSVDGLRSCLHLLVLAEDLRRQGGLLERFMSTRAEEVAGKVLLRALAAGAIDAGAAREAGRVLDALDSARTPVETVIAVERAAARAELVAILDGEVSDGDGSVLGSWGPASEAARLSADALEGWDGVLDETARALVATPGEALSTYATAMALPAPENSLLQMLEGPLRVLPRSDASALAHSRVARIGLAMRECLARKGALPATLADLVPEFLPAVPLDPWNGKPLLHAGDRVWSVGSNGLDDGGKSPEEPDSGEGDVVATVPVTR